MGRSHVVRQLASTPGFRPLLAVRLTGQAGDGLAQGALFGAAFFNPHTATSAAAVAMAFTVLLLPYSLVGPLAGVLLDRWSRQRILLTSNLLRSAALLVLAVSLASTGATSAPTLLVALVVVSTNRFILSGLSAALPHVVPAPLLVSGNAVTTTLGAAATTIGAVASLGLRWLWGEDNGAAALIAVVGAASYAGAGLVATRIGRASLGPDLIVPSRMRHALPAAARGMVDGAQHLRARREPRDALLALVSLRFFSALVFVLVLLAHTRQGWFHAGIGGLSAAVAATITGGLAAAVVTPSLVRRMGPQRWVLALLVWAAVTSAALLPSYRAGWWLAGGLALGFAAQGIKICVDTLLQESIEDSFRGRVFSLYDTLFNLSFIAASAAAAALVPDDGHSPAVVAVVAGGYVVTAVVYGLRR